MRNMRNYFSAVMAVLFAASCGASVVMVSDYADAKPKKQAAAKDKQDKKKAAIASSLGSLRWGMSADQCKKAIAEKIMDDFRVKAEGNTDLSFVDNLRKSHTDRVENMQKSYMQLTRDNSASLSVSIVGEEFMPDAGEALITSREDNATRYYFFKDDKLYKMAVVYDSNYLGPIAFDTFCATTAQKYGKAKSELWDDDGNFLESVWEDGGDVRLAVKNKYSSYSTVLMVFSDDAVERTVADKHKAYFASLSAGPEVSSAIDALTADSGDSAGSSVDAMLGKKTKVDLLAGLSQDDIDIINGVTTEKELEKKKKAKAKKAKQDRKNDAKAKQGLEIY